MILKKKQKLVFEMEMPPSVNAYYMRTPNGVRLNNRSRHWIVREKMRMEESGVYGIKVENNVRIDIMINPDSKRKSDVDNRVKSVLDLLQKTEIIEDDEQVYSLKVVKTPYIKDKNNLTVIVRGCDLKEEMKQFNKLLKV